MPLRSTPADAPAPELPYEPGAPIPYGYQLREEPRRGLVTAGYIVTAIPYGIGAMAALSADFDNASGYLLLPFVGPWLTMGRRKYSNCPDADSSGERLGCIADVFVVMGLIMDGVMQVAGGTLLLTGYLATSKKLLRNDLAVKLRPGAIGADLGFSAIGTF